MQVIMGGSGSTGSSLLKNILNRHPEIFSGGETAFFAKKMIYRDWKKARTRVLKRKFFGLQNHGWHIYNGTDLLQKEYLWEKEHLKVLLGKSTTVDEFTTAFYSRSLELNDASIWLEKTPANSACFSSFLDVFPNGKVIHIVRNPLDTIASLVSRGFDLYYATGIYLLNTASGIGSQDSTRSHTVKYEDLINDPTDTVQRICSFLEVNYAGNMLEPQGEVVDNSKLGGWNFDETKAIEKGAVGRFNKLSDEKQNDILEAINLIHVNGQGKGYYETNIQNVKEICDVLKYEFYDIGKTSTYKTLKSLQNKDRYERIKRGYPTGFYYPIEICK